MGKNKIDFNNMDLGFDEIDQAAHETVFRKINIKQLDETPENNEIYEHDKEADDFLKEEIIRNGIMNPIVVVKSELHAMRYTIISGHRRTRIAKELGMTEIEARELITITPEQKAFAKIMLITANSTQRDRKPSEKAKEIQYLKALTIESEIENVAKWISNATQMSERNVYRYEKLASQSKDVQEAVDKGEVSVKQAIGEVTAKRNSNKDDIIAKPFDINKTLSKVSKLVSDSYFAFENKSTTPLTEKSLNNIQMCINTLQRVLDRTN